ncbi:MAG: hypothetical protein WDW38_008006 [Sanguina aurantia]
MDPSKYDLIPGTSRNSSLVCAANHIVYAHIVARLSECDAATEAARRAPKRELTGNTLPSLSEARSSHDRLRPHSAIGGPCSTTNSSGDFGRSSSSSSPPQPPYSYRSHAENVHEFDGCSYQVLLRQDGSMQISFTGPPLPQRFFDEGSMEHIRALIKEHFPANIASLLPAKEGVAGQEGATGPRVSMEVNVQRMSKVTHGNSESRQHWAMALASLRVWVIGNELRRRFLGLRDGTTGPGAGAGAGATQALCHRQGQVFFVTRYAESLAIVFPLRFPTLQDAAIGASFLQEFDAARTHAALRNSVSSTYRPSHAPPGEIQGTDPADLEGVNGGYMVFQIFRRHVDGPHLDDVLWAMSTFYHLVNFNIKSSKSMIHERLRKKVELMLHQERLSSLSLQPQQTSQLLEF